MIQCPMLDNEWVMTYCHSDAPCFYSYTAPFVCDGNVCYYRFDHDEGYWDGDTLFCMGEYKEYNVVFRNDYSKNFFLIHCKIYVASWNRKRIGSRK